MSERQYRAIPDLLSDTFAEFFTVMSTDKLYIKEEKKMREKYVEIEIEMIRFENRDVITSSDWEENELHELDKG